MRTRTWRRRLAALLTPLLALTLISLVPAPANAAGLANGGFETGDFTSWSLRRELPTPTINSTVFHSGAYAAQLGGYPLPGGVGDSQIMQTVAVPATGTTTLDLEWYPYSQEYANGGQAYCMQYDWQDVLVYDETGTTLGAGLGPDQGMLMHTCSNAQTWEHLSFDLSPWAGSTIALVFGVRQDYSVVTTMLVDDVTVTNTPPASPYDTSVTDVTDPDAYTCPAPGSTMIGFEDQPAETELDGDVISGATFAAGSGWFVLNEMGLPFYVASGNRYVIADSGDGRLDFAAPVADVSILATIGVGPASLEAYDASDTLLATAGPAGENLGAGHMTELRIVSESEDIAYVIARGVTDDMGNTYFAFDDICYAGLDLPDVATTTGLVSDVNPSVFGQSVELKATVSPDSGSVVPTGTVEFWEGATKLGEDALNSSGVAKLTVSDFAVGTHAVIAEYLPDAGFTGSESEPYGQDVTKAATTTTINSVTPANPTYGQTLSFDTIVAPVAPGAGTPSGEVTYEVNKFAGTPEATGYQAFDPSTDLLPAGTHHVEAIYPGDDSFEGSRSNAFVVEVDKAETTVSYLGDYLAILGNDFTFKANVDSPVGTCEVGREVTFTLLDGSTPVGSFTATSGAGGAVSKTVSTTGWLAGEFDVLVEVAGSSDGNCASADNAGAMDVVTVASPGDAATGGGWYFWKDAGASKRVNFGFTVTKEADNTYKGSLLLMNQGAWRLKGDLDSFTRTDAKGQAGGTGTLYQWVLADPSDPTTGSWQNPRTVSFKIAFTDMAAGKATGKKGAVVDQFALTNLSVRGATLPVSGLKGLKGGNIVLR